MERGRPPLDREGGRRLGTRSARERCSSKFPCISDGEEKQDPTGGRGSAPLPRLPGTWAVALALVVHHAVRRRERWAWNQVAPSLAVWFTLDTFRNPA